MLNELWERIDKHNKNFNKESKSKDNWKYNNWNEKHPGSNA